MGRLNSALHRLAQQGLFEAKAGDVEPAQNKPSDAPSDPAEKKAAEASRLPSKAAAALKSAHVTVLDGQPSADSADSNPDVPSTTPPTAPNTRPGYEVLVVDALVQMTERLSSNSPEELEIGEEFQLPSLFDTDISTAVRPSDNKTAVDASASVTTPGIDTAEVEQQSPPGAASSDALVSNVPPETLETPADGSSEIQIELPSPHDHLEEPPVEVETAPPSSDVDRTWKLDYVLVPDADVIRPEANSAEVDEATTAPKAQCEADETKERPVQPSHNSQFSEGESGHDDIVAPTPQRNEERTGRTEAHDTSADVGAETRTLPVEFELRDAELEHRHGEASTDAIDGLEIRVELNESGGGDHPLVEVADEMEVEVDLPLKQETFTFEPTDGEPTAEITEPNAQETTAAPREDREVPVLGEDGQVELERQSSDASDEVELEEKPSLPQETFPFEPTDDQPNAEITEPNADKTAARRKEQEVVGDRGEVEVEAQRFEATEQCLPDESPDGDETKGDAEHRQLEAPAAEPPGSPPEAKASAFRPILDTWAHLPQQAEEQPTPPGEAAESKSEPEKVEGDVVTPEQAVTEQAITEQAGNESGGGDPDCDAERDASVESAADGFPVTLQRVEPTAYEIQTAERLLQTEFGIRIHQLSEQISSQLTDYLAPVILLVSMRPDSVRADAVGALGMYACAQQNGPTLIVDADADDRQLSANFAAQEASGLLEAIRDARSWTGLVRATSCEKLQLLPVGSAHRGEAGTTAPHASRVADLVRQWQREYDLVIIDGGTADAEVARAFCHAANATFLCVPLGICEQQEVLRAAEELPWAGANLKACITTGEMAAE